jgi:hypothetical protein
VSVICLTEQQELSICFQESQCPSPPLSSRVRGLCLLVGSVSCQVLRKDRAKGREVGRTGKHRPNINSTNEGVDITGGVLDPRFGSCFGREGGKIRHKVPIRNSRFPQLLGRHRVVEHQFRLLGRRRRICQPLFPGVVFVAVSADKQKGGNNRNIY